MSSLRKSPESRSSSKVILFLYTIIVLSLIYMFHVDLFVSIVRVYSLVNDSPRAEHLLGDYYYNLSRNSSTLAETYYVNSFKKFNEDLKKMTEPKKLAHIKSQIAILYQCGKGVPQNLTSAKHWYEESLKDADAAAKKQNPISEELLVKIKEYLNDLNTANQTQIEAEKLEHSPCKPSSPVEFIKASMKID